MKNKEKEKGLIHVQDVFYVIGGRWKGSIMASLCDSPKRFNELKRDLGKITSRSLTKELRFLEMNKLLTRNENEAEKTVIYEITEHGESLYPLIQQMIEWGKKHRQVMFKVEGSLENT